MAREAAGTKKHRDQLRAVMHDQGCSLEQIAAEMARRFGFRIRQAWRHTHGLTQDEVAAAYNRLLDHDQAPMTGKRISDFEAWPHGGVKPTTTTLAVLATLYCTTPSTLVDLDDRQALSAQELLALDIHTPPPATPKPPSSPHPHNITTHAITMGDRATPPGPDTPTTTNQPDHTPAETTTHQLTAGTTPPPQWRHRWHLIPALLLAIITTIGGALITQTAMPDTALTMPTHSPSPSTPSSPTTSGPSPTSPPPSPSLPSQIATPPHQPLIPSPPPIQATPAPHQPPAPPPVVQQTPPPSPRPTPLPPPSEPPVTKNASAAIVWENMYYDLCLEEQDEDGTGAPGALRLRGCDGSTNQMWTEKTIADNPVSLAKNLVSAKSGKCVTYQPESGHQVISVRLAPCGQDGQAWVRHWNDAAYIFEAAGLPGLCMSVPRDPAVGGVIGIRLRECGPPSPLTDWLPHFSAHS